MKNLLLISIGLILSLGSNAQDTTDYVTSIKTYQEELNTEFRNPDESPLEKKDLKKFTELQFWPIDEKYRVTAKVILAEERVPFNMPTTIPRKAIYWKYADLVFDIDGQTYSLEVYQSESSLNSEEYKDYLFLPFSDLTSGNGSYGGGRYVSLRLPEGVAIEIDFNKAYNPYCAYSSRFSCPLVPRVNRLTTRVEAGVKDWGEH